MNSKLNKLNSSENNKHFLQKKKQLTYDDILSSMKMVVSSDGVLQYISTNKDNLDEINPMQKISNYNKNMIEPQVKNSYIYNKLFKNYKDPNAPPIIPRRPLSLHEIKILKLKIMIEKYNARLRVSQLKSKKISYTTNTNTYIYNPPRPSRLPNHLFKLKL